MNIQIYAKNLELTESIKSYTKLKIEKLEKYLHPNANVHVELSVDKHHKHGEVHTVEVNITMGNELLRAKESDNTLYEAIDKISERMKTLGSKDKGKHQAKIRKMIQFKRLIKSIWPWQKNISDHETDNHQ